MLAWLGCTAPTSIDIDEEAYAVGIKRFQLLTKQEAVNFALRILPAESLSTDEARRKRGSARDGSIDEMRSDRLARS